MPKSGSVSQWEPKWESHRARETASHFSIPKHCFVARQLTKTLFCRDTSKIGVFCWKLLKYALRPKKMAASAMRADSTLSPTLPLSNHFATARRSWGFLFLVGNESDFFLVWNPFQMKYFHNLMTNANKKITKTDHKGVGFNPYKQPDLRNKENLYF